MRVRVPMGITHTHTHIQLLMCNRLRSVGYPWDVLDVVVYEIEVLIVRLVTMDSTISTVMHRFSSEHRS
jgi:hypothetical protein